MARGSAEQAGSERWEVTPNAGYAMFTGELHLHAGKSSMLISHTVANRVIFEELVESAILMMSSDKMYGNVW